jgi:hypothetical protein
MQPKGRIFMETGEYRTFVTNNLTKILYFVEFVAKTIRAGTGTSSAKNPGFPISTEAEFDAMDARIKQSQKYRGKIVFG